MNEATLEAINTKLNAILAILVDQHVRDTGGKPKHASPDSLLAAAGLSPSESGKLLGKTTRAVQKRLQTKAKVRK